MGSDLIGTREAAEIIGVSPERVTQLIRNGALGGHKIGRQWVLSKAEVTTYTTVRPDRIVTYNVRDIKLTKTEMGLVLQVRADIKDSTTLVNLVVNPELLAELRERLEKFLKK